MSKFIISVENIYKKEYPIPEEDIGAAVKDTVKATIERMKCQPYDGSAVANFYIRSASDPESENRRIGSITLDGCEACTRPVRAPQCCDEDCNHCPCCDFCDEDEDEEIDEADNDPTDQILSYLDIIFDQLEHIIDRLEAVSVPSTKE